MQAEPVNFNTKQIDMRLSFIGEQLNMNTGYYGSFFSNSNGSVNMSVPNQLYGSRGTLATLYPAATGGTSLQNVLQLPFALPPDNQAHQFYVDGNYAFTKTTKATFKYLPGCPVHLQVQVIHFHCIWIASGAAVSPPIFSSLQTPSGPRQ